MKHIKNLGLLAGCLMSLPTFASTVAIIDSGTDMLHKDIAPKAWVNAIEIEGNGADDDRNGYTDDINGWNFAENNNQVIDYSYLSRNTFDVRRYFEIQSKMLLGQASEQETRWLDMKKKDQQFLKDLQVYANFMHGTHVAGLAIRNNDEAKVLAVKLIPTEVKLPIPGQSLQKEELGPITDLILLGLMKAGLTKLAEEQAKILGNISSYIHGHKADVANGSFGTGFAQAKILVETLFKAMAQRDPSEAESYELTHHFLSELLKEGRAMVDKSQTTLFVFAAGNDGNDNDKMPTSPANIQASNSLTVAASTGFGEIAKFSNYGATTVDVVAPGVAVESTVPGNKYMKVSGTSQAAPYVANIASLIKDMNSDLTPVEIKRLIMKTVDVRSEWANKVRSSGFVNTERALMAAKLSKELPLSLAIDRAKEMVQDQRREKSNFESAQVVDVMPLPSPFVLR